MPDAPLQSSLFEEDYLLRELSQVAHVPQVALTERGQCLGCGGDTGGSADW